MAEVNGTPTNAVAQPVEYVEADSGDFGQPSSGSWQNAGDPVDAIKLDIDIEEKNRAGIDVDTDASELYCNLVDGDSPISTRQTVEINGARYNVKGSAAYDVSGFPSAAILTVVKQ